MTAVHVADLTGLVNSHSATGAQVNKWRKELDTYLDMMQTWSTVDPSTCLEQISSVAARLIQIRCELVRIESRNVQAFRTKELDPVMAQVEFLFKVHSRRLSSLSLEWDVSRGQAT